MLGWGFSSICKETCCLINSSLLAAELDPAMMNIEVLARNPTLRILIERRGANDGLVSVSSGLVIKDLRYCDMAVFRLLI